jgi:uncharacterized protein (TIRG00374 family)
MDLPDRAAVQRLIRWVIGAAMAWALAVLAAVAAWGGSDLWQGLRATGPMLAAVLLASFAANHALRFLRWQWLLRAEGHRIAWRRSLSIFLGGLALLPTPAKIGVAARTVLLLAEGVPAQVSLAAYFAERLTDLLGLLVLASLLLAAPGDGAAWILPSSIALTGLAVVWIAPAVLHMARARVGGRSRMARSLDWTLRFFADAAGMLASWRLPAFVLIGMAANIATGLLLWWILREVPLHAAAASGIVAASHLSGSISMLPGGLGGFEVAMLAQLSTLPVSTAQALMALAVVRVATLWGSVVVGLPLLLAGMRRQPPA